MYKIKFNFNLATTQTYLNKQARKGYILNCITPFTLLIPLKINIYQWIQSDNYQRVYQLVIKNPNQLKSFKEDGWHIFKQNNSYDEFSIVYKDFTNINDLTEEPQHDLAMLGIKEGIILLIIYGLWRYFIPSYSYHQSLIGFILHNSYLIIAMMILIISMISYIKSYRNRKK